METTRDTDGNILSLESQTMAINFPAIAQVDAYWEGLRQGRPMPSRTEVDPRGLSSALEFALMLEVVAKGVARIRVAGSHLSDLLGMEVRGMPMTVFMDTLSRSKLSEVIESVVSNQQVAEIKLSNTGGIGRPPMTARLLLTPLSVAKGENPRILACLQSKGSIGRVPRRFNIDDVHTRRIIATAVPNVQRDLTPARAPRFERAERSRVTQFAEPKAVFKHAGQSEMHRSERSYLRLVKSD